MLFLNTTNPPVSIFGFVDKIKFSPMIILSRPSSFFPIYSSTSPWRFYTSFPYPIFAFSQPFHFEYTYPFPLFILPHSFQILRQSIPLYHLIPAIITRISYLLPLSLFIPPTTPSKYHSPSGISPSFIKRGACFLCLFHLEKPSLLFSWSLIKF